MTNGPVYVILHASGPSIDDAMGELCAKVGANVSGGWWRPIGGVSVVTAVIERPPDYSNPIYAAALNAGMALKSTPAVEFYAAQALVRCSRAGEGSEG